MKWAARLCALLLCGCAFGLGSRPGFAAFVVNQDAHSQAKPGKSYSAEPCTLESRGQAVELRSGKEGEASALLLKVELPAGKALPDVLGQTLQGATGEVQLPGSKLALEKGQFTLQTLQGGVARGNFNARAVGQNPPWEVVGSFEALMP